MSQVHRKAWARALSYKQAHMPNAACGVRGPATQRYARIAVFCVCDSFNPPQNAQATPLLEVPKLPLPHAAGGSWPMGAIAELGLSVYRDAVCAKPSEGRGAMYTGVLPRPDWINAVRAAGVCVWVGGGGWGGGLEPTPGPPPPPPPPPLQQFQLAHRAEEEAHRRPTLAALTAAAARWAAATSG